MRQAVIFDLYETLITENHPEWHTENVSPAARLGLEGEVFHRGWRSCYRARTTGALPSYAATLEHICTEAEVAPPLEEIERLQAERETTKARPFARMEADILAMLDQLRAQNYAIGVITNCAFEDVMAWDESPLAERVDVPIFSCDVGMMKPDKEIYTLACNRLDADPAACVFVGDGGSDELRGAQAAGLKPIWATWFIERWPWDWVGKVAPTASDFPRCRTAAAVISRVKMVLR